jgi:uncharacterized protein (DUF1800 family)
MFRNSLRTLYATTSRVVATSLFFALFFASSTYAQTTYFPAQGIFNGFLEQINISECDNQNDKPLNLRLRLVDSTGFEYPPYDFQVAAFGATHTILNDLASIRDKVGIYHLELGAGQDGLGDKLNCRTVFYRPALIGAPKQFEYAYSLAVQNPQSGRLSGIYNSIDPAGSGSISNNWLSIINFDTKPFTADVDVYNSAGSVEKTVSVASLPPGGRQDIPLGHPRGQVAGLYVVNPQDSSLRYDAVLVRYNQAPDTSFNFAFPLRGATGSCTGQPVLASTMGNGLTRNWLEIANTNDVAISVNVEVRDGLGTLVHSERPTVAPRSQYHVYLSDKIDPLGLGNVGSARVLCDDPTDKLIIQSTFYGSVPGKAPVEWAYSTQELGRTPVNSEATISAPVNTFVGMANWFKFADASLTQSALEYSVYDQAGQTTAAGEQVLPGGGTADLGVHAMAAPNSIGSVSVSTDNPKASYSGEMLRVLSRVDGQIGTIISIPAISSQNGVDGGAFRGDPQSLAVYRDALTLEEAQRLATVASFGGGKAEIDRILRDGLRATVDRLLQRKSVSPVINREADDWLDSSLDNDDNGRGDDRQVRHDGVKRWWLTYLLKSPNSLHEKLALFWHDRFASSCRVLSGGDMMEKCLEHFQLIRNNATGNFRTLLRGMTIDFLMLKWLNGERNVKQSPDENYAREIMELFSLGEAQSYGKGLRYPLYSESGEIKELARALTGYTTQLVNDQFGREYVITFVLNRHDDGSKTVWPGTPYELSGNFEPLDVPDLILNQRPREVGRYISGALFTTFCHDHPSEQLKSQMADILISSNWEIEPLVRRILLSEACYSKAAYKSRIMDPLTFAIGFLKRTGLPMRISRLEDYLDTMGMDITDPVDVFGWAAGYREGEHNETSFWSAYTVEYANFITSALTSHEYDFRDDETGEPIFDFCSLNPSDRARSDEVVDHIESLLAAKFSSTEKSEYIRYLDNEPNGTDSDGNIIERPRLYDPRVSSLCRAKLGGLLWLSSLNPSALTY